MCSAGSIPNGPLVMQPVPIDFLSQPFSPPPAITCVSAVVVITLPTVWLQRLDHSV